MKSSSSVADLERARCTLRSSSLVLEELGERDARACGAPLEQLAPELAATCRAARCGGRCGSSRARASVTDEVEPVLATGAGCGFGHRPRRRRRCGACSGAARCVPFTRAPVLCSPSSRVDRVREVDRRRAAREDAHVALGREDVDLVLEEIDLHALEELGRVLELLLALHQLAEPAEALRRRFGDRRRRSRSPCTSSARRCRARRRGASRGCGSGSRCARARGR